MPAGGAGEAGGARKTAFQVLLVTGEKLVPRWSRLPKRLHCARCADCHAVLLAWLERFPKKADQYDEYKAGAWRALYNASPVECARHILKAFRCLTQVGQASVAS